MLTNLATAARNLVPDFVLGALPTLAALGGILALFLFPLWYLTRSLGA